MRVRWTARRSNQSVLKEINPEDSLEGLMLKLQYFDDSLEKTLMLGKTGQEEKGDQRMRRLVSITNSTNMSLSKLWEIGKGRKPRVLQFMGLQTVTHKLMTRTTTYK